MENESEKAIAPALSAQEHKFVDAYCNLRDVAKAAIEAGLPSRSGAGMYRRQAVHAEITRRMGNITAEVDKQIAKKRVVNIEQLDKSLMEVVRIPRKVLEETPQLATPKVNAIEMGYKRVGILIDGNFTPDSSTGPAKEEAPRIYRPMDQTIITHQITETRQVVTQHAAPAPSPAAPAIDAEDPWKAY